MRHLLRCGVMLATLLAVFAAAADPAPPGRIATLAAVPYQEGGHVPEAVRHECASWTTQFATALLRRSRGGVEIMTPEDFAASAGKTLAMAITDVRFPAATPATWDGPKLIRARGELRQGGAVLARFDATVYKRTPLVYGSCKQLDRLAPLLAGAVADWLREPADGAHLVVADSDEPPPPEETPAQPDPAAEPAAHPQ